MCFWKKKKSPSPGSIHSRIFSILKKHEGLNLKPYTDTVGKLTIGYGRNLEDRGISEEEALFLLSNDVEDAWNEAMHFSFFPGLSETRKVVIVDMIFNLGIRKFHTFKKMIAALENGYYQQAADEMVDSLWAIQVGGRAVELVKMMRQG